MDQLPQKKTILVVDDEVDLCEILQFDLEDSGYAVHTAYRVAQALNILQKEKIDLIVSDIRMPGGDGIHLLTEVRRRHFEEPPVIFVSGFADVTVAEAFHKGIVAFIAKPLAFETLLAAIECHLKDKQARWTAPHLAEPRRAFERIFPSLRLAEAEKALLLGRGGLFLRIDEDLPRLDEVIKVTLKLGEEDVTLEGQATCRWIRNANGPLHPRGAGLEWCQLKPAAVQFLMAFIKEQKRLPFIPME